MILRRFREILITWEGTSNRIWSFVLAEGAPTPLYYQAFQTSIVVFIVSPLSFIISAYALFCVDYLLSVRCLPYSLLLFTCYYCVTLFLIMLLLHCLLCRPVCCCMYSSINIYRLWLVYGLLYMYYIIYMYDI